MVRARARASDARVKYAPILLPLDPGLDALRHLTERWRIPDTDGIAVICMEPQKHRRELAAVARMHCRDEELT